MFVCFGGVGVEHDLGDFTIKEKRFWAQLPQSAETRPIRLKQVRVESDSRDPSPKLCSNLGKQGNANS